MLSTAIAGTEPGISFTLAFLTTDVVKMAHKCFLYITSYSLDRKTDRDTQPKTQESSGAAPKLLPDFFL